ncbi:MAG TPA: hypothetical protein VMR45_04350 [Patescibacteria group bacterium]|nr:hypothetical protein [Patescibacteria group bacterium]
MTRSINSHSRPTALARPNIQSIYSTATLQDDFNDINGTLLSNHTLNIAPPKAKWSQTSTTAFYIQSNLLVPDRLANFDRAWITSGITNFTVTCTLTPYYVSSTVKNMPGIMFYYLNNSNYYYFILDGASTIYMYQVLNGSTNQLMNIPFSQVSGRAVALRLDCVGGNITLWLDGEEVVTYTIINPTVTSVVGIRSDVGSGGSSEGNASWGNLKVQPYLGSAYNWPIFKKGSSPIISLGGNGSWESTDIHNPSVVYNPRNSTYNLLYSGYYSGSAGYQQLGLSYTNTIEGAWTKASTPVFNPSPSSWQNGGICYKNGLSYYIYETNNATTLGLATSPDLNEWTVINSNVISGTASQWDSNGIFDAFLRLRQDGNTFELWYTGSSSSGARAIGYATSTDGVSWTKCINNPVIAQPYWQTQTISLGEPSVFVPPGREGTEVLVSFDAALNGSTGKRFIAQALTVDGGVSWSYRMMASAPGEALWQSVQNFDSFIWYENGRLYLFHSGASTVGTAVGLGSQIGLSVAEWPYGSFIKDSLYVRPRASNRTVV